MPRIVITLLTLLIIISVCVLAALIYLIEQRTLWQDLATIGIVALFPSLCIGIIVWGLSRNDRAPDYLLQMLRRHETLVSKLTVAPYFDHHGFCFAIVPGESDGVFHFDVYYQNRYERECSAQLEVRPSRGFFLARSRGVAFRVPIDIPPAGYGVVRVPLDVPESEQSLVMKLDVTAAVRYPSGHGRMMRFRHGVLVSAIQNPSWKAAELALTAVMIAHGHFHHQAPAQFQAVVPAGNWERPPDGYVLEPIILWKLGDPSLQAFKLRA